MDWGIVERLAPSLAWPIVAFIALPFVIWKLDELIGAIGHAKSLSEQLPELLKLTSEIAQTAKNVDAIRENTEQIRGSQKVEHAERLAEEAGPEELLDGGAQAQEATEATTPLVPSRATSQTFKKLYEQLAKSWGGVLAALEGAYDRASLGVEKRR